MAQLIKISAAENNKIGLYSVLTVMTRATRSFKFDQLLKRVKRLQEIVMVLSQSSLL